MTKQNGELATSATEILETWTNWIQEKSHIEKQNKHLAQHLKEKQWGEWNETEIKTQKQQTHDNYDETNIHEDLKNIRKCSKLQKYLQKYPYVEYWHTAPYTQQEVKQTLKKLKTEKRMEVME